MSNESMSKQEAAQRLGVSEATVLRMTKDGRLQGYHVAGKLRIKVESIEALERGAMAGV